MNTRVFCDNASGRGPRHSKVLAIARPVNARAAYRRVFTTIALLTLAAIGFGSLAFPGAAEAQEGPTKVTVKVTDSGFDPNVIEVEQGKSVELTFVWANVAHAEEEHIMVIPGYKLETEKINAGHRETTVKFIAAQAGTFDFKCDLVCDTHDVLQRGQIKVKASSGGGTAALEPSKLIVDAASGVLIKGGTVSLSAGLQDKAGKPISKADVTFYVEQTFLGKTGLVEIGTARTGPSGYANILFHPTTNVARNVVVKFEGVGLYDASEITIPLVGSEQFLPPSLDSSDDSLHGVKGGARATLLAVIAGVWLVFGFIVFQAVGIRRAAGGGGTT